MSTIHDKSSAERRDTQYHRVFEYVDPQHTSYTKKPHEDKTHMTLQVEAHYGAEWLQIKTEETKPHGRDVRFITHSIVLRPEQAKALRDMLNEQYPV